MFLEIEKESNENLLAFLMVTTSIEMHCSDNYHCNVQEDWVPQASLPHSPGRDILDSLA